MKNILKTVIAGFLITTMTSTTVFATGIGYIDYKKIQDNYSLAKTAAKLIDNKSLELQQYLVDKEKQYKALDTPLKKQNFEEKTTKEFKAKQEAFAKLKIQKETEIYDKIQEATNQVLIEQKLDAIFDYRVIFVGGTDVTNLVLNKLNNVKK